jgi:hypothetical protein
LVAQARHDPHRSRPDRFVGWWFPDAETAKSRQPDESGNVRLADMTKAELIAELAANKPHLRQRDAELIVEAVFDRITEALGAARKSSCVRLWRLRHQAAQRTRRA